MLSEISDADSDPRIIQALVGKDGSTTAVNGMEPSDWNLQSGSVLGLNSTGDGNYTLSLDLMILSK